MGPGLTASVPADAQAFDDVPDVYERGRPTFPQRAIDVLVDRIGLGSGRKVADVAAGTGKLTRLLPATGADVIAVEPLAGMRAHLRSIVTEADVVAGVAEAMPVRDESLDAVTVAHAFHWFRTEQALLEFWRVLRPGGGLALLWNKRDDRVPWMAELDRLLAPYEAPTPRGPSRRLGDPAAWERSGFTPLGESTFDYGEEGTVGTLCDRVASVSFIAALGADERETLLERVRALVRDEGERFPIPYVTRILTCTKR